MVTRCGWARGDRERRYHDREWGVPVHDDRRLFEYIVLEGAQAGLSWRTILAKREWYRTAFENFDPDRVAAFDEERIQELCRDEGLVRHRAKITSAVENARRVREVQASEGSLDCFLWAFVGGEPIVNERRSLDDLPGTSPEARRMSRELKRRGFTFVGPKTCYSLMQATGMVNDHLVGCFRYEAVKELA